MGVAHHAVPVEVAAEFRAGLERVNQLGFYHLEALLAEPTLGLQHSGVQVQFARADVSHLVRDDISICYFIVELVWVFAGRGVVQLPTHGLNHVGLARLRRVVDTVRLRARFVLLNHVFVFEGGVLLPNQSAGWGGVAVPVRAVKVSHHLIKRFFRPLERGLRKHLIELALNVQRLLLKLQVPELVGGLAALGC